MRLPLAQFHGSKFFFDCRPLNLPTSMTNDTLYLDVETQLLFRPAGSLLGLRICQCSSPSRIQERSARMVANLMVWHAESLTLTICINVCQPTGGQNEIVEAANDAHVTLAVSFHG